MKLADIVLTDASIPELAATEREDVIRELVMSLSSQGVFDSGDAEVLVEAAMERERKGTTGFGKGVAVPHVKHDKVTRLAAAIGRSSKGIDFAALDRAPVFTIFLLMSPANTPDIHLAAMEKIFRHLQSDTFRRFLRQADSAEAIADIVRDADEWEHS